jgi:acetyltransferase-like isoleucine patch superfamily enzyme
MLRIADSAQISPLAHIEESERGSLIEIGENVVIDSFVRIKPTGGTGDVRIGSGTVVNSGVVIYTGNGVEIGSDVLIAANSTLAPVNHEYRSREAPIREQGFLPSKGGIVIEDDVWIGANCVILDGARLRRGCVLGAGSVARGEIGEYAVCVGAPAVPIGSRR